MTSKQGILNWRLSNTLRNNSYPLLVLATLAAAEAPAPAAFAPSAICRFTPSMAALASEPPVPLIADAAKLAVCSTASVSVVFPLKYDVAVSGKDVAEPLHRGSNQSALKSKREETRTKSRIEQ